MKKLFLFLILFLFLSNLVAAEILSKNSFSEDGVSCFLRGQELHCYSGSKSLGKLPKIKNLRLVSVSSDRGRGKSAICVIDDSGLGCWKISTYGDFNRIDVPQFKNAKELVVQYSYPEQIKGCVVEDDEVKCWGDASRVIPKGLKHPRMLRLTASNELCLLDDNDVICGGIHFKQALKLKNPRFYSVFDERSSYGIEGFCALDDDGAKCNFHIGHFEPSLKNPQYIQVGSLGFQNNFACAIDDEGVKCWGKDSQYKTPKLNNPVAVYFQGSNVCALDNDGVTCWPLLDETKLYTPYQQAFVNPYFISLNQNDTCVGDDVGVTCIGEKFPNAHFKKMRPSFFKNSKCYIENKIAYCDDLKAPDLKNPYYIEPGHLGACALDDDGLYCWSNGWNGKVSFYQSFLPNLYDLKSFDGMCAIDKEGLKCWDYKRLITPMRNQPTLVNPQMVSVEQYNYCVLDDNIAKCWVNDLDRPEQDIQFNSPTLKNPQKIDAGNRFACALDDDGVKCWGDHLDIRSLTVPSLKNPKALSVGAHHVCAIDDDGVKCWGNNTYGQIDIPLSTMKSPKYASYMINVEGYLSEIEPSLTEARAMLVRSMRDYAFSELSGTIDASYPSQYFLLGLISPVIQTMDSDYYIKNKIPLFKSEMLRISKSLGFNSVAEAISKYPNVVENRQVALKSVQAAVTVALEFVSIQEKAELQSLLRQIGQLMIDPSDISQIKDLIAKLESPTSPLQKLTSPKSAFLIDVINLAKDWLKKVK